MSRGIGSIALGCALVLTLGGCCKLDLFRRAERPSALSMDPRVGKVAPEIEGETFDGQPLKLSEYRGKVTVVVFWYSGCIPCMAMVAHERDLVERHRGKPFAFIGVNLDTKIDAAQKAIATTKMTWPIVKPGTSDQPIDKNWGVTSVPAIFVIDPDGVVRYANVRGKELDSAVETLLAEDASAKRP